MKQEEKPKKTEEQEQEVVQQTENNEQKKLYTESEMLERLEETRKTTRLELEEAEKLKHMNELERLRYQLEQKQTELEQYHTNEQRQKLSREAAQLLNEKGVNGVPTELVDMIITNEAGTTQANVGRFAELIEAVVAKRLAETLKGATPIQATQASDITKAEILAIQNPVLRIQTMKKYAHLFE